MRDRGGERGPAGGFEYQREVALHLVDAFDDLVRGVQVAAALGSADHGSDARPGARSDLCCQVPDAAGGAGNKHTLAEQRRTVRSAVNPATGRAAASSRRTLSGNTAIRCAGTAARSAHPALSVSATTRAPASGPLPLAAGRMTTPPMSWPGRQPSGRI